VNDPEFQNPIDPDKVSDAPGLLTYAHHVGSAVIRPADMGKVKTRALSAMYEQTDQQMAQIKQQIDLLAEQVRTLQKRKEHSEWIYRAELSFEPVVGSTYHLYEKTDGKHVVSMLAPGDWGRSKPNWNYLSSVKLLGDHTWQILDSDE
jgi:hypothetical protein